MKNSPRQIAAAIVLAAIGIAAVAQTPPEPGRGRKERMERLDPAQMQQMRQEHRAHRFARLKETLDIVPMQEAAWNTWLAAMQPPANWKRPDRAELDRLTTPERIDRMRALRAERNAMMDKRAEATKGFYAQLNFQQKQAFDQAMAHRGHRGGHHHQQQG